MNNLIKRIRNSIAYWIMPYQTECTVRFKTKGKARVIYYINGEKKKSFFASKDWIDHVITVKPLEK